MNRRLLMTLVPIAVGLVWGALATWQSTPNPRPRLPYLLPIVGGVTGLAFVFIGGWWGKHPKR